MQFRPLSARSIRTNCTESCRPAWRTLAPRTWPARRRELCGASDRRERCPNRLQWPISASEFACFIATRNLYSERWWAAPWRWALQPTSASPSSSPAARAIRESGGCYSTLDTWWKSSFRAIWTLLARLLKHLHGLGAQCDAEERVSFMQAWRYSGYSMSIPESNFFGYEEYAPEHLRIGLLCEPHPGVESGATANSPVNSAPLVAGIAEPNGRGDLVRYIYVNSRALIGSQLADQPRFSNSPATRALRRFRFQMCYSRHPGRVIPLNAQNKNSSEFTALLDVSNFDWESSRRYTFEVIPGGVWCQDWRSPHGPGEGP